MATTNPNPHGRSTLPVCLARENPNRLVSLWDIVNQFSVEILITRMAELLDMDAADLQEPEEQQAVIKDLTNIREICSHLSLQASTERAARAIQYAHDNFNKPDGIAALANDLHEDIRVALSRRKFLFVEESRSAFVDNPNLFGPEVARKFKSAISDVREAGNCLAADCNTGAVFHLMRAVEWGLRELAANLGVKHILVSKKPGKKKLLPIAYAEWERILDELQEKVDEKILKLNRGRAKQKAQQFYYPVLQDIRGIRDAWRNHTMHTRSQYTAKEAEVILGHVGLLLSTLAKGIRKR